MIDNEIVNHKLTEDLITDKLKPISNYKIDQNGNPILGDNDILIPDKS